MNREVLRIKDVVELRWEDHFEIVQCHQIGTWLLDNDYPALFPDIWLQSNSVHGQYTGRVRQG